MLSRSRDVFRRRSSKRHPVRSAGRRHHHRALLHCEWLERRELLAAEIGGDFIGPINQSAAGSQMIDQPAMVGVSIADASVVEGNAGAVTLEFDVNLTAATTEDVHVNFQISGPTADELIVERVAAGLLEPVYVTVAPDDPNTMFVVEQDGIIKRLDLTTGVVASTPFLTVTGLSVGGERGLLGLAFHPDYATNRSFYINMTDSSGDTLVRKYTAQPDGLTANPASAQRILGFDQPFGNHNGGWMDFGPDGFLYVATGDGGSGNDPQENAQDITDNLLGKMLRIDVDGDDFPADANRNYAIPPSNPFVGISGDDEIWAYGLRNPWRNSFDRETGDLIIADVGQNAREEINFQSADSTGGENYGWREREGTIATPSVGGPKPPGAIDPIYDYPHNGSSIGGFSVSGGYVYRGPIDELQGNYFFADYVTSRIWSIRPDGTSPLGFDGTNYSDFTNWTSLLTPDVGTISNISSFGEDAAGNLYIVDRNGEIFRISQGADYKLASQSVTIAQGSTSATLQLTVIGDRLPETNELIQVSMISSLGATIDDGLAVGTILNDDAPKVVEVAIADAAQQRSIIDSLTLTFDSPVSVDNTSGDAFELINLDTLEAVNVVPSPVTPPGTSVMTLQFGAGPSVVPNASGSPTLADGRYRLTVNSTRVDIGNVALDGDGDGSAGGDYAFGTNPADEFFRFYGDSDGDGDVDGQDYGRFALTFLRPSTDPAFDPAFDFDGDDDVDGLDYARFGQRFLKRIAD